LVPNFAKKTLHTTVSQALPSDPLVLTLLKSAYIYTTTQRFYLIWAKHSLKWAHYRFTQGISWPFKQKQADKSTNIDDHKQIWDLIKENPDR